MTYAQSENLPVPAFTWRPSRLGAQIVDRATALALRRTTKAAARDKRRACIPASLDLACPPTIRTLDLPPCEAETPVPVVIVPPGLSGRSSLSCWAQRLLGLVEIDRSWMTALFVALSVTLALAIPLELLRQNG